VKAYKGAFDEPSCSMVSCGSGNAYCNRINVMRKACPPPTDTAVLAWYEVQGDRLLDLVERIDNKFRRLGRSAHADQASQHERSSQSY